MNKRLLLVVNVDWLFISRRLPIAIQAIKKGLEVYIGCLIMQENYPYKLHDVCRL